jgi:prevent-host-death family protein
MTNNTMIPISEAKGRLSELVRESDSRDVLLMRHGRPAAVVMSYARHEALLERLEDVLDRLSVHERSGLTMEYEKLATELALDD